MNGITLLLLGALAIASENSIDIMSHCRLEGAVGVKAQKLFDNRLLSTKAQGDIFDETVKAFQTNYDDKHPDSRGAKGHSGYWQGEYWGKTMLSHCAYVRYSGDVSEKDFIHRKALELVENFQRPNGYLGTYADEDFILGSTWNIWGRKYTMWALVEAYDLTQDKRLLDAAVAIAVHINRQLKRVKGKDGKEGVSIGETGCFVGLPSMSLLKPLVMIFSRTNNADIRELIEHIIAENDRADGRVPNLIANAFTDKPLHEWYPKPQQWAKAYELMSVVEGFIHYADVFRQPRLLEVAKRIFDKLSTYELNGIASVGYHDHFIGSRAYPNTINESCDVIHWMRLCKFLYQATGETRYLDIWERAFLNAFMAGIYRNGRWGTHDVRSHGKRHLQGVFEVGMYYHFCCIANDPRGFCDYADMMVESVAPNNFNLNFYTDCDYRQAGVHIRMVGNYPVNDQVVIAVTAPNTTTLNLRVPEGVKIETAPVKASAINGRLVVKIPAGETSFTLSFDMPARIESWGAKIDGNVDKSLAHYLWELFEMPMHNKEMKGMLRKTAGVRVLKGPLILAKGMLSGDCDNEVFNDLGIDEQWKVSLTPRRATETWGSWLVTFEKDGVSKTVGASDFQSIADFDDWQNSFSIWF